MPDQRCSRRRGSCSSRLRSHRPFAARNLGGWKGDNESRSSSRALPRKDPAAMPFDEVTYDGKSDSGAGAVRSPVTLEAHELSPDRLALGRRNPGSFILDLEARCICVAREADEDFLTRRPVPNG